MNLTMEKINFKYKKSVEYIIKNFSMEIKTGNITALLGESGSGKSTILRIIAGLEAPESGSLKADETILCNEKRFVQPEKRNIGMVFQDYALFPHLNIYKNVEFAVKDKDKIKKKEKVERALEITKLSDYKDRYPHELSGGQQQRAALARTIAGDAELILMDEPFSNLDAHIKMDIKKEIKEIFEKCKKTVIFVTHDREDALFLADNVIIIKNGEKQEEGKTKKILNSKEDVFVKDIVWEK